MDADNTENDSLTMQKITENTSIQNILFSWYLFIGDHFIAIL